MATDQFLGLKGFVSRIGSDYAPGTYWSTDSCPNISKKEWTDLFVRENSVGQTEELQKRTIKNKISDCERNIINWPEKYKQQAIEFKEWLESIKFKAPVYRKETLQNGREINCVKTIVNLDVLYRGYVEIRNPRLGRKKNRITNQIRIPSFVYEEIEKQTGIIISQKLQGPILKKK